MTEQILDIEPTRVLVFEGAFTNVVTSYLSLTNNNDRPVCFKVKTTAPKQYCVKPNAGILLPGEAKRVKLMLQPTELPIDGKAHKFMIQAAYNNNDEATDVDQFWKDVSPSKIASTKLAVQLINKPVNDPGHEVEGHEEYAAAVNHHGASQSTPVSRKIQDVNIHEDDSLSQFNKERVELVKKLRALQEQNEKLADGSITNLQIVLITIAALLIGLIIGKLF